MRIALLAHSTNPRGGVAHALALAEALCEAGHEAVVHAPDAAGAGFYRSARCGTVCVPASAAPPGTRALVETRIADYVRHFGRPGRTAFDVFHAHDGISANALATLAERGVVGPFVRTVHHLDAFADPVLAALQARGVVAAGAHLAVSRASADALRAGYGFQATVVGNGVDRRVFDPAPAARDAEVRKSLGEGAIVLAVGGIEARKNTRLILASFAEVHAVRRDARLVIAGGASLLDHGAYRAAFEADLAALGDAARRVHVLGKVAQDDMPALLRVAGALVFPSLVEGFGLVALEAIACGTPAVVSRIPPFTEHFCDEVLWCDPHRPGSIADAVLAALDSAMRARLAARAGPVLAAHGWDAVAARHLAPYRAAGAVARATLAAVGPAVADA